MIKHWLRRYLGITGGQSPAPAQKPQPAFSVTDAMVSAARFKPDAVKYEVKAPFIMPGVIGQAEPGLPVLALDDAMLGPVYSYANNANFGPGFPGYPYLAELTQRAEYRSPAEIISKEMTRKWIKLNSTGDKDNSDEIKELQDMLTYFGVQESFRKLSELDCFYGRAQLYIDIKGQDNVRSLPLLITPETMKPNLLQALKVIEPMWTTPYFWNAIDPTQKDFYKPTSWWVLGRNTHASRLLTFISREMPDILKPSYNFGGISASQIIEPYVKRWLTTVTSVNNLIHNFSIINLATDMEATLGEQAFNNRLGMFRNYRDNQGLMLTNKDSELLTQLAVPLGSLDALQAQAQEHMAGPLHIPLIKLFGITPTGLNATAEPEIVSWYDWIASEQEAFFGQHLRTVVKLMQINRNGKINPDIQAVFQPMKELDGEALARVRKSDAEAGTAYINAGVIDAGEERERLADDPDSPYTNLDVDKIIEAPVMQLAEAQGEPEGEEA